MLNVSAISARSQDSFSIRPELTNGIERQLLNALARGVHATGRLEYIQDLVASQICSESRLSFEISDY